MLFREEDEDLEVLPFADRADAGLMLAGKLAAYSGRHDVIVLGLPRGGVPVAAAVASALKLPLERLCGDQDWYAVGTRSGNGRDGRR